MSNDASNDKDLVRTWIRAMTVDRMTLHRSFHVTKEHSKKSRWKQYHLGRRLLNLFLFFVVLVILNSTLSRLSDYWGDVGSDSWFSVSQEAGNTSAAPPSWTTPANLAITMIPCVISLKDGRRGIACGFTPHRKALI